MKLSMFVLLVGVTACDLRPAPKGDAASGSAREAGSAAVAPADPTPTPTPTPTPAPGPAMAGSAGSGSAVAAPTPAPTPAVNPRCAPVADKIAAILIAATQDAAQRAAIEQDRATLVTRMADACARDAWPATALTCFETATTAEQIQACGAGLAAPQ